MQRKSTLVSLIKVLTCAAFALSTAVQIQAADAKKSDASGNWTWSTPGRDGGPGRKSTLKLKVDGDKVTGAITSPGRGADAQPVETAIENGKVTGDDVSFTVTRAFGDNKFTQKFNGKLAGDSIKGKIESERNGEAQSRDWEAKRETAEKKPEPAKKTEPEKKN